MDNRLLDLHDIIHDDWLLDNSFDFDDSWNLDTLDLDSVDNLRDSDDPLLEERHFDLSFDNLLDLSDQGSDSVDDSLNLSDFIDWNQLLSDDLYLSDFEHLFPHSHNLLNDLWHF